MIRLITTRRLARMVGGHDREATLADLKAVSEERDRLRAEVTERIALAQKSMTLRDQSFDRAATAYNTRIVTALAERDQARAIAVDLEQQLAAATDGNLVRELREQRDRMAELADTMQAAAEAADLPIGLGITVEDYRAAVRAVVADVTRRRREAERLRELAEYDPEAACRAGEAIAAWNARPEAL